MPIMEDIDFITRILKLKKLKALNINISVSARRWENINILSNAFKNALLRHRWRKGENIKEIYGEYYSIE